MPQRPNGASLVGIDTSEIIPGIEGSWASEFTAVPEVVPGQENQAIVAFTAEANSWGDRHVFIYEELIQFTSTVLSAADSIAQVAIDAVMIEPPSATEPNPAVTTQPYEFDNRLVLVSDFDANGNEIWVYIPAFLTGEKDEPISSYFSIYPNPSIGMLRIEIPDNERSNYEIVLTDLSGRIVHTFNSGTLTGGLTLNQEIPSQISNGTYLVKLKTENQIQGRKLVLNR